MRRHMVHGCRRQRPTWEDPTFTSKPNQSSGWIYELCRRCCRIPFLNVGILDFQPAECLHDVLAVTAKLKHRLERGQAIYLHCWGGNGRAGLPVVAACMLLGCMLLDTKLVQKKRWNESKHMPMFKIQQLLFIHPRRTPKRSKCENFYKQYLKRYSS